MGQTSLNHQYISLLTLTFSAYASLLLVNFSIACAFKFIVESINDVPQQELFLIFYLEDIIIAISRGQSDYTHID